MDQIKILSESVVKIENVKPEPDDDPAEAVFYFTERDELSSLKREMKMEDEEEELKPLVGVFLDPEEVPSGEVKQPDEDPLALGTVIVRCESETSPDKKNLLTEVVMYLLSQEASKVPAKRVSIVKTILAHHSKSFRTIIAEAKDVLFQVFGYRLLEYEGRYFMINKYEPSELGLKILREPSEHKKRCSLLMLVLSLIFMEGGTSRVEVVWDFLKRLRIKVGDVPDPVFGDVKKILTKDCVHMLYLQYVRREGTDPPVYEFSSGPRADAEIPKRKLLEFVCKVYGNSESDWPVQAKQLEQAEHSDSAEGQRLSQLLHKRMRLSQPSSSQPGPSSQR